MCYTLPGFRSPFVGKCGRFLNELPSLSHRRASSSVQFCRQFDICTETSLFTLLLRPPFLRSSESFLGGCDFNAMWSRNHIGSLQRHDLGLVVKLKVSMKGGPGRPRKRKSRPYYLPICVRGPVMNLPRDIFPQNMAFYLLISYRAGKGFLF